MLHRHWSSARPPDGHPGNAAAGEWVCALGKKKKLDSLRQRAETTPPQQNFERRRGGGGWEAEDEAGGGAAAVAAEGHRRHLFRWH